MVIELEKMKLINSGHVRKGLKIKLKASMMSDDNQKKELLEEIKNAKGIWYEEPPVEATIIASMSDDNLKKELLEKKEFYEEKKAIIIASMKDDNLKKELLEKGDFRYNYRDSQSTRSSIYQYNHPKACIIASMKDDAEKLNYLKDLVNSKYLPENELEIIISSLQDKQPAICFVTHMHTMSGNLIREVVDSLGNNDEAKLKLLEGATNWSKLHIIASLSDDSKKIKFLDRLKHDYDRAEVIASLSDDSKKIELMEGMEPNALGTVIASLSDDLKKIELFEKLKQSGKLKQEPAVQCKIIMSLSDDDLKKSLLGTVKQTKYGYRDRIIMSMSNIDEEVFRQLSHVAQAKFLLAQDAKSKVVEQVQVDEKEENLEDLSTEELEKMLSEQKSRAEELGNEVQGLKKEVTTREFYLEKKKKEIEFLKSQGAKVETDEERAKREEKERRDTLLAKIAEQRDKVKQQEEEKIELMARVKEQELESTSLDAEKRSIEK